MENQLKYSDNYRLIKDIKSKKLKFDKFQLKDINILQDLVKLEGRQAKYWNNNKAYKLDDEQWTQSLSESMVCSFMSLILNENEYAYYYNEKKKSGNYAISENFIPEGYQEKTFADVLFNHGYSNYGDFFEFKDQFNNIEKEFDEIIKLIKQDYNIDLTEYFLKVLAIDCITLNIDRHMGNLNFFVNTEGYIKNGIIFDNGASLLADFDAMYQGFTEKEAIYETEHTGSITFSSGNFDDTMNFIIKGGFKPFKFNIKTFIDLISHNNILQEYDGYTNKQINRSLNVIINRLKYTENKLWEGF